MSTAERLVQVRKEHRYNRREAAAELGVPYTTLTKYENGTRNPPYSFLYAFAKKFGVTVEYLACYSDYPEKKEIEIMKKIINGKVYDTGTAENVGRWNNNCSTSDFGYCSEALYRKRTGEFFLHGEGGPSSRYAICIGNNEWSYGEAIIPLSYDAAREWAKDHLSASEYESIFGEVAEDGSRVTVTLSLSASAVEKAKRAAAQAGMGLSAYIEKLI